MIPNYFLYLCLAALVCSNAFFVVSYFKAKKKSKEPAMTIDSRELLRHLMNGTAVVKVSVIDPGDILLRSPRL